MRFLPRFNSSSYSFCVTHPLILGGCNGKSGVMLPIRHSKKGGVIINGVCSWKGKLSLIGRVNDKGGIFEYSQENLVHEIPYHKFAISHEETALHLTFSSAS